MLRHCLAAAGILIAFFPAAASARDNRPPVTTGFRVEALTGYDYAAFDSATSGNGLLYGVGLGYDIGLKRLRLGLEGEVTDSTAKKCFAFVGVAGSFCLRTARDLYVGARLGGEVSRGVLLYGKAGYTNFRESNVDFIFGTIIRTHPNFDGFRVGAGAEFAIGRRAFVKAEYRLSYYERSKDFDRNQAVIGFGIRF